MELLRDLQLHGCPSAAGSLSEMRPLHLWPLREIQSLHVPLASDRRGATSGLEAPVDCPPTGSLARRSQVGTFRGRRLQRGDPGAVREVFFSDDRAYKIVQHSQNPEFEGEIRLAKLAASHGIGPKVYWSHLDREIGVIAMERFGPEISEYVNYAKDRFMAAEQVCDQIASHVTVLLGLGCGPIDLRTTNALVKEESDGSPRVGLIDFDTSRCLPVEDIKAEFGKEKTEAGLFVLFVARLAMFFTALIRYNGRQTRYQDYLPELMGEEGTDPPMLLRSELKHAWQVAGQDFFTAFRRTRWWTDMFRDHYFTHHALFEIGFKTLLPWTRSTCSKVVRELQGRDPGPRSRSFSPTRNEGRRSGEDTGEDDPRPAR